MEFIWKPVSTKSKKPPLLIAFSPIFIILLGETSCLTDAYQSSAFETTDVSKRGQLNGIRSSRDNPSHTNQSHLSWMNQRTIWKTRFYLRSIAIIKIAFRLSIKWNRWGCPLLGQINIYIYIYQTNIHIYTYISISKILDLFTNLSLMQC